MWLLKKTYFCALEKQIKMSKKENQNEELIVDVEEVYSKTETFIEENKNTLSGIVVALAIVIGGYFAYQNFYLAPMEVEAAEEMFMAEKYFAKDSMNLAINGDGTYPGFLSIVDNYGGTKAANLANYYLGVAFLRTGQYEAAIDYLGDFSGDDHVVASMAYGAMGDAYAELGDLKKAASKYDDAVAKDDNEFTAAYFLMKAGRTYELLGDYEEALERYKTIDNDYPLSTEAADINKLISRAESFVQ